MIKRRIILQVANNMKNNTNKIIIIALLIVFTLIFLNHLKQKKSRDNIELTLSEQCYYKEYDFTQNDSPYPLKDFSFFRYEIDKNIVKGEDYYFRAESDSYLTKFHGIAKKENSIIHLDTIKRGESEERLWEEDFTFQISLDGVLFKDSANLDVEKINCDLYYQNLEKVDLYYKEIRNSIL